MIISQFACDEHKYCTATDRCECTSVLINECVLHLSKKHGGRKMMTCPSLRLLLWDGNYLENAAQRKTNWRSGERKSRTLPITAYLIKTACYNKIQWSVHRNKLLQLSPCAPYLVPNSICVFRLLNKVLCSFLCRTKGHVKYSQTTARWTNKHFFLKTETTSTFNE